MARSQAADRREKSCHACGLVHQLERQLPRCFEMFQARSLPLLSDVGVVRMFPAHTVLAICDALLNVQRVGDRTECIPRNRTLGLGPTEI